MHELGIAQALADQVARHAPAKGRVREVEVRIGARRGLEADSIRLCWEAVTHGTPIEGAALQLDLRPWTITCPACDRQWESAVPFVPCPCGEHRTNPSGGDELALVAFTVDDESG